MDFDVQYALDRREWLAKRFDQFICSQYLDEETRKLKRRTGARLRTAKVYVWEPHAYEALKAFWSLERNRDQFDQLCRRKNGRVKIVPALLEESFHYFPVGGLDFPGIIPLSKRNADCDLVFPPRTNIIAVGDSEVGGLHAFPILLNTLFLDPSELPPEGPDRQRILSFLLSLPARDVPLQKWISGNVRVQTIVTYEGHYLRDAEYAPWLLPLYAMRIFLEQPFLGYQKHRVNRAHAKKIGTHRNEEVTRVYMREAPNKYPRLVVPHVSRLTGRHLEFEVDVRGHTRHCHSGKVVPVRAHKRGPKGVHKERVVKVIR